MDVDDQGGPDNGTDNGTDALAAAARGWHRIQLAVLGFIGFCGVMWAGGSTSAPDWAKWLASALAVGAFALALLSIYLVGRVAYPIPRGGEAEPAETSRRSGSLRGGIRLTYGSVALVVAATLTAWWPVASDKESVEVQAATATWCGTLAPAPECTVRLDTADGPIDVPFALITTLRPVGSC